MFFPERIKSIKKHDRVLEIGPGATPFPRADVLLEKRYSSDEEFYRQCGAVDAKSVDGRTIYYDGDRFPFDDKEFDYVICSHVLEHVDDVESFCAEIFRVSSAGYFEYPLFYYEYVYDIPEHVNILKFVEGGLVYARKKNILTDELKEVRRFWFETLSSGYTETVAKLVPLIMEGFEWDKPFNVREVDDIARLCHSELIITGPGNQRPSLCMRARTKLQKLKINIFQ